MSLLAGFARLQSCSLLVLFLGIDALGNIIGIKTPAPQGIFYLPVFNSIRERFGIFILPIILNFFANNRLDGIGLSQQ